MSARCEPPEELRGVDGWHWLTEHNPVLWIADRQEWEWGEDDWVTPEAAYRYGYRYLTPVTPPATVAALVEALEAITTHAQKVDHDKIRSPPWWHHSRWTFRDYGLQGCEGFDSAETLDKARAALALYRGGGRAMSVVTDVPGEWINVAMRAWVDGEGDLRQVLAAVAPLIAKAERERCAGVAETHEWFVGGIGTKAPGSGEAKAIAAAIRALKETT